MSEHNFNQSALFISTGHDDDDDEAVLVVGGCGGTGKGAALLTNRLRQARGEQGNRETQWKRQPLFPMHEARPCQPGLLLLGKERVLVCGGGFISLSTTAEILQLPRADNDMGIWTLLTQPMSQGFLSTYFINFDERIVAVGKSLIILVAVKSKQYLFNISCLHFSLRQEVRRIDNYLHMHASGKNSSTDRSLWALLPTASHWFAFQDAPLETFVWKPIPNIQSNGRIAACFTI